MNALRARRAPIRERWEALLRTERVNSPLANPDVLTYLIPAMIDRTLDSLLKPLRRTPTLIEAQRLSRRECACGFNPYLAFFSSGEQALMEALVFSQSVTTTREQRQEEVAELYVAVRRIALAEMEAFCGICTARPAGAMCGKQASANGSSSNVDTQFSGPASTPVTEAVRAS